MLSVPKRLRYFMRRDGTVLGMVLRIFLRVIEQSLRQHCPDAAQVDKAARHIGAVAFIHRFGSSLKEHVHFHVCVVDGVFEVEQGEADATATALGLIYGAPKLRFHPVSGIDETPASRSPSATSHWVLPLSLEYFKRLLGLLLNEKYRNRIGNSTA